MRWLWILGVQVGCKGGGGSGKLEFECDGAELTTDNDSVIRLTFETKEAGESWVEFGADGGPTFTSPRIGSTTVHEHILYGLPSGSDISYTAVVDYDGEEVTCDGTFRTDETRAAFPAFEVTIDQPDKYDEQFIMMTFMESTDVLAVINRQGQVVWSQFADEYENYLELKFPNSGYDIDTVAIVNALLWPEQGQIVYNLQSLEASKDIGSLFWTNWLKEKIRDTGAPKSHHTFSLQPETGTVAYMTLDVRQWFDKDEGKKVTVIGDAFVEQDTEDNVTEIFSVWDAFEVEKTDRWDVVFYSGGHDWTHGNAMTWFPETESYFFSFANLDAFMEFVPGVGMTQVFDADEITFAKGSTPFDYQHDPRWAPDGSVSMMTTGEETTAVTYAIGDDGTFTETWSHGEDEGVFAFALGENHLLPNGNRLLGFGSGGKVQEITADGEVVWEVQSDPSETWFGSVAAFSDFYTYR